MDIRLGIFLTGCLILAACGSPSDSSGSPVEDEERPEDRETVFDPMISTMDRAKGVEDLNMSRKDEMDAALAEQDK
jgi:hypothetical protein